MPAKRLTAKTVLLTMVLTFYVCLLTGEPRDGYNSRRQQVSFLSFLAFILFITNCKFVPTVFTWNRIFFSELIDFFVFDMLSNVLTHGQCVVVT